MSGTQSVRNISEGNWNKKNRGKLSLNTGTADIIILIQDNLEAKV